MLTKLFLVTACALLCCAASLSQPPDWCKKLPRPAYKNLKRILPSDPWFEVYNVATDVYAIYEPHQFQEVISYLIVGQKQGLLLDTGMGIADLRKVVQQITKLPILVLNTHSHWDHIGNNWQFDTILGENLEFTRSNSKGESGQALKEWVAPDQLCGDLPRGFDPMAYEIKPFRITRTIIDGETLDLGGRALKVLFSPGHTPDSLCVLDSDNGLLFTGDSFYLGQIYLFVPETDFGAYAKSIERLLKLRPKLKMLLPAHNVPVASPAYLQKLMDAVHQVQSGEVTPQTKGDQREYFFEDFSFLMHK